MIDRTHLQAPYIRDDPEEEAERGLETYDLLVIPGVELTDSDPDPDRAAHALAVGLDRLVTLDHGLPAALREARASGAATIAAHPHRASRTPSQAERLAASRASPTGCAR